MARGSLRGSGRRLSVAGDLEKQNETSGNPQIGGALLSVSGSLAIWEPFPFLPETFKNALRQAARRQLRGRRGPAGSAQPQKQMRGTCRIWGFGLMAGANIEHFDLDTRCV